METFGKILIFAGRLVLFIAVTIIFIPAFLIVNALQSTWNGLMGDLFNL